MPYVVSIVCILLLALVGCGVGCVLKRMRHQVSARAGLAEKAETSSTKPSHPDGTDTCDKEVSKPGAAKSVDRLKAAKNVRNNVVAADSARSAYMQSRQAGAHSEGNRNFDPIKAARTLVLGVGTTVLEALGGTKARILISLVQVARPLSLVYDIAHRTGDLAHVPFAH